MELRLTVLGSNCVGKTFVCDLLKVQSTYNINTINVFESQAQPDKTNQDGSIPFYLSIRLFIKIFFHGDWSFWKRYLWIKHQYEKVIPPYTQLQQHDILLLEEGLVKKMYESFPVKGISPQRYHSLLLKYLRITPILLEMSSCLMDGYIYVYSSKENIFRFMQKRNFFTNIYKRDHLLFRYEAHHILYQFLLQLCAIKGIPFLVLDSAIEKEKIAQQFDAFIKQLKTQKKP